MNNLFLTLIIAFVVIVIAIAALAIGWLITGKTKIERGTCGRDPTKSREDSCSTTTSCDLCSHSEKKVEKKIEEEDEDED